MADNLRKQTLLDLIESFQAWDPQVCVVGNLPAGECASALLALVAERDALREERDSLVNLLHSVVDELELSDTAIETHGPLGTPPHKLVRLVLDEKNRRIAMLRSGFVDASHNVARARGETIKPQEGGQDDHL